MAPPQLANGRSQALSLAAILVLASLSSCGVEQQSDLVQPNSAAVSLNITMPANVAAAPRPTHRLVAMVQRWLFPADAWAATVNEIAALVVQVTGPGIPSPITARQPVSGARAGQVIPVSLDVSVGAERVFTVSALNAANRPIFQGQSEPVTLVAGQTATANVQLADTVAIVITTTTLPDGTEDRRYTATVAVERQSGTVTWAITEGRLPPGLTLNPSTGEMTGTPTAVGIFPVTVRATDTSALFDEQRLSVTINPAPIPPRITTTTMPNGTVGSPYSAPLAVERGTGAPTWSVVSGALPPGLSLNGTTGVIAGTPTASGTDPFRFTIRATDSVPLTDDQELSIRINPTPPLPTITRTTLPNGTVRARYSQTLTATGGTGALTWSLRLGGLPPGLSLNGTTSAIAGTPTTEGRFDFTVRATDTLRLIDEQALSITIENAPIPPPTITTRTLPGGTEGTPYSATLRATGGTGTLSWRTLTEEEGGGDLPSGLSLNGSTGVISGTPPFESNGSYNFTVRVTDTLGRTDGQDLVILVSSRIEPPFITTTSLPGGTVGASYSETLTATGGTGALTWTVSSGGLPPGLSLNPSTGEIASTPTTEGSFSFTVRATDTAGLSDNRALSIAVVPDFTGNYVGLATRTFDQAKFMTKIVIQQTGSSATVSVFGEVGSPPSLPTVPQQSGPAEVTDDTFTFHFIESLSGSPFTDNLWTFNLSDPNTLHFTHHMVFLQPGDPRPPFDFEGFLSRSDGGIN